MEILKDSLALSLGDSALLDDESKETLHKEYHIHFYMPNYIDRRTNTVTNDFSGWKVKAENSPFTVGNNTNTQNALSINGNNAFEESVSQLLKAIKESKLDDNQKQEFEEIIVAANEEMQSESPKKVTLKGFLSSAKEIITVAAATPQLIEAYNSWANFIQSFLTNS